MRHKIDESKSVITYETSNPYRSEPTEQFAYYIAYRDSANQLRITEERAGFFDHEDPLHDAMLNLDSLDMTPEPKTEREPIITTPYHTHICYSGCGFHRCVNPKCEVAGEFSPKRVAEILCPISGEQTGARDYFKRRELTIAEYIPLEVERAIAA